MDNADNLVQKRKQANMTTDELLHAVFLKILGDPVYSDKWAIKKLKELVADGHSIICGPFGSQLKIGEYVEKGIPVLGIDNVDVNRFVWAKPKNISVEKFGQLKAFSVKPNDILITRTGTVGRTCVVPEGIGDAAIGPNLLRVTLDTSKVLLVFFSIALNYFPSMIQQIKAMSPGATVAVFNTRNLKELRIALPPIALQKEFASIVDKIDNLEKQHNQSTSNIDELFQSLTSRAFKGELIQ